jgi:hypothetical protein
VLWCTSQELIIYSSFIWKQDFKLHFNTKLHYVHLDWKSTTSFESETSNCISSLDYITHPNCKLVWVWNLEIDSLMAITTILKFQWSWNVFGNFHEFNIYGFMVYDCLDIVESHYVDWPYKRPQIAMRDRCLITIMRSS